MLILFEFFNKQYFCKISFHVCTLPSDHVITWEGTGPGVATEPVKFGEKGGYSPEAVTTCGDMSQKQTPQNLTPPWTGGGMPCYRI